MSSTTVSSSSNGSLSDPNTASGNSSINPPSDGGGGSGGADLQVLRISLPVAFVVLAILVAAATFTIVRVRRVAKSLAAAGHLESTDNLIRTVSRQQLLRRSGCCADTSRHCSGILEVTQEEGPAAGSSAQVPVGGVSAHVVSGGDGCDSGSGHPRGYLCLELSPLQGYSPCFHLLHAMETAPSTAASRRRDSGIVLAGVASCVQLEVELCAVAEVSDRG